MKFTWICKKRSFLSSAMLAIKLRIYFLAYQGNFSYACPTIKTYSDCWLVPFFGASNFDLVNVCRPMIGHKIISNWVVEGVTTFFALVLEDRSQQLYVWVICKEKLLLLRNAQGDAKLQNGASPCGFTAIWFVCASVREGGSEHKIVLSTQSGILTVLHQSSLSPFLKSIHVSPFNSSDSPSVTVPGIFGSPWTVHTLHCRNMI